MFGGMDVADQTVQPSIAFGRPLCDEARKMANRAKEIEAGHTGGVQDLHEHSSRDGLQSATILGGLLGGASTTRG